MAVSKCCGSKPGTPVCALLVDAALEELRGQHVCVGDNAGQQVVDCVLAAFKTMMGEANASTGRPCVLACCLLPCWTVTADLLRRARTHRWQASKLCQNAQSPRTFTS